MAFFKRIYIFLMVVWIVWKYDRKRIWGENKLKAYKKVNDARNKHP